MALLCIVIVSISFRLCVFQPLSVNFVGLSARTMPTKHASELLICKFSFMNAKLDDHTILIIRFQNSSLLVVTPA